MPADLAGVRLEDAERDPHRRGLAGAVRTDEAHDLARRRLERHAVQRDHVAEASARGSISSRTGAPAGCGSTTIYRTRARVGVDPDADRSSRPRSSPASTRTSPRSRPVLVEVRRGSDRPAGHPARARRGPRTITRSSSPVSSLCRCSDTRGFAAMFRSFGLVRLAVEMERLTVPPEPDRRRARLALGRDGREPHDDLGAEPLQRPSVLRVVRVEDGTIMSGGGGFVTPTRCPIQSSCSSASTSAVARSPRVIERPGPLPSTTATYARARIVGQERGRDHRPVEGARLQDRGVASMLGGDVRELARHLIVGEDLRVRGDHDPARADPLHRIDDRSCGVGDLGRRLAGDRSERRDHRVLPDERISRRPRHREGPPAGPSPRRGTTASTRRGRTRSPRARAAPPRRRRDARSAH